MRPACVAIPAKDEADRIGACLSALAIQRDGAGAPLPDGAFSVLVLANDCRDDTVAVANHWASLCPHPVEVVSHTLPPERRSAGLARRAAMDLAADRLERAALHDGVIITTDADSAASPTWISATMAALAGGADAVAGYVDAHAAEIVGLGPVFLGRGRLEDRYLRAIAEIYACVDPIEHDPWPNHRVSSGASLAVTLSAYRAIGGLPALPVGEDAALSRVLALRGFKVRHAMDVTVSTSCRFDGRAEGGAADTMRHRHAAPDAPCDPDVEKAQGILRRAVARRRLRDAMSQQGRPFVAWAQRLGLDRDAVAALGGTLGTASFEKCWERLVASSPVLGDRIALRPSDLPGEIARAEALLRRLRARPQLAGETRRSRR